MSCSRTQRSAAGEARTKQEFFPSLPGMNHLRPYPPLPPLQHSQPQVSFSLSNDASLAFLLGIRHPVHHLGQTK